ncbi:ATP-binding protein [Verticiella sediminum]|uniref:ATP-binding protein n=1 Tax=Verticiella sediminum TaxID=1247510 RepID=A0A556AGV4_9BURK|nr:ATP-binding protein [Verticiella sediminum]TSH92128.1 ATP-binding protein [Verticiella sediminum]
MTASDSIDLDPTATAVGTAIAWLETLAERDRWPARVAMGLTLSVDEALTNVVAYAFGQRDADSAPPRVRLSYVRLPAALRVTITDNGIAFDPTAVAPPTAMTSVEQANIGGHGVQLMRHYLSRIAYARQDGENRLTLEIDCPQA